MLRHFDVTGPEWHPSHRDRYATHSKPGLYGNEATSPTYLARTEDGSLSDDLLGTIGMKDFLGPLLPCEAISLLLFSAYEI